MSDDEDEPLYPKKTLDRVVGVLYGGVETKTVRVEGRKCQVFPGKCCFCFVLPLTPPLGRVWLLRCQGCEVLAAI